MKNLFHFNEYFSRRDYIIKYNIFNINKVLKLKNIEVVGHIVVDDLSDFWLLKILNLVELVEKLTKQKVVIFGDISKQKYSQNEKKEIYVKTILRGYNLHEFLKYFYYMVVPYYIYKYNKLDFVKAGSNTMVLTISNGNVVFGLSSDFIGIISIKFNFNLDKNLEEYLSLMSINIKNNEKNK